MNENTLTLSLDKTAFSPSETVTGRIKWYSEKAPQEIQIYLAWKTDGRGTQDTKSENTHIISDPPLSGEEKFSLKLPASPYAFSGKLVHLQWYVEARSKKGKLRDSLDIVMGPNATKVTL